MTFRRNLGSSVEPPISEVGHDTDRNRRGPGSSVARDAKPQPADVLVVFGITGDLAKVMTFRSLYRLEKRGLLDCPIVGVAVDDWTDEQLKQRARESIIGTGEQLDEKVFERFAERLSYLSGDFSRQRDLRTCRDGAQRRRRTRSSTSRSRRSSSGASSRGSPRRA